MLNIAPGLKKSILEQAIAAESHEVCGILAGKRDGERYTIDKIYKMTNASNDPQHCYFMDAKEQFQIMKAIRNEGLEMVGIYHSHPGSGAYPSKKDVELAFYPEALYVIVSLKEIRQPAMRAFRIVDGNISEEEINS